MTEIVSEILPIASAAMSPTDEVRTQTRNTIDCDQSNVHSSRAVFSAISQGLFRSSSLYRRSAGDPPS